MNALRFILRLCVYPFIVLAAMLWIPLVYFMNWGTEFLDWLSNDKSASGKSCTALNKSVNRDMAKEAWAMLSWSENFK